MKQSQLFTKTKKTISEQEPSINAQLLERAGFVSKLMSGVYSYLPLGLRVLTKIENIVRQEMNKLAGQEILMSGLQPKENWLQTQRWDKVDILFKLKGAGDRDLALGPTHEEIITPLVGQYIQSYKDLPQYVYQIQTKFRNEARAKSGLLRGREFRMKDLYSFHTNEKDLDEYYDKVITTYLRIFERCGLGELTYLTFASGGIFSKYSHEFQTVTQYGEDIVHVCLKCKIAINKEIIADQSSCPVCGNQDLKEEKAIEVGNIFKLMQRFSDAFSLAFTDKEGKQQPVVMGCYGLGTSRLMGSIVEILHDEKGIIWPKEVAPFHVHLISLAREEAEIEKAEQLYLDLQRVGIEVLYDDRAGVQAGQKFADSDLIGIPLRIVISAKTLAQNSVEVKERAKSTAELIEIDKLVEFINRD
ncbi:MAG: His/Gly/Thr/Pro-type tRNA ligase C-terminal domain-containing protein [Candidatus Babeliales bacterium]|nr:His/Gly/Thr/Pro-type tRNA ligase C-terminal domain-containing protein [Candidatus Babeliales bacterium]